jgi:hypothetical protein
LIACIKEISGVQLQPILAKELMFELDVINVFHVIKVCKGEPLAR